MLRCCELSALRGLFSTVIEEPVTFVNAPALAAERGVEAEHQHRDREPQPPQRRRRARGRAPTARSTNVSGTLSGPQQVEKIVADQRPQLRPARRGHQPDHQLRRPAGSARQDRHAARLRRESTSTPRNSARTPRARARRSCCGSTATCPQDRARGDRRGRRRQPAGSGGPVMKLAVIAGDGIGPEVIAEALKVLDAVLPGVEKTEYDLGARRYHATGETAARRRRRRAEGLTTRSCSAPSAIRRCPAVCSSAGCC